MAKKNAFEHHQRAQEKLLIQSILQGNRRAFDEFADDYMPPLYRFASRRLGGDRELTVEIVQSTMCKAIARLETFRGEAALMTWLCACCRNEIAAYFRRQGKQGHQLEFDAVESVSKTPIGESGIDSPERATLRSETVEQVHATLDSLPPNYASALEWKYLQQLPVKEIGKRLGLSVKAAESVLTRARSAFRRVYGESLLLVEENPGQAVANKASVK